MAEQVGLDDLSRVFVVNLLQSNKRKKSMRDTEYAIEQATAAIGDSRIERLFVKAENQEEIRLSWWPNGKMARRPLDMTEDLLVRLLAKGIREGVLSTRFLPRLIERAGW